MTMQRWDWQDQTEANTVADGNGTITVYGHEVDETTGEHRVLWSGWAIAAIENPSGSLTIKRRITLDDDGNDGIFDVASIGPGNWSYYTDSGFSFDMERFLQMRAEQAQAQANAAAAERLGLMPGQPGVPMPPQGLPPNRQQRRHPG